jgi:hypothetical protein
MTWGCRRPIGSQYRRTCPGCACVCGSTAVGILTPNAAVCVILQVLKSGNPQQVLDSLHTLLQSIMTLYKIARYYGTPQRMTTLFSKITNQMIRLCKDSILAPGKLWDQDKATLISNMQVCDTRDVRFLWAAVSAANIYRTRRASCVLTSGHACNCTEARSCTAWARLADCPAPCVCLSCCSCVCGCVKPTSSSTSASGTP